MEPNEIHEIVWSLEQIQSNLADLHSFLQRDPNYRSRFRKKKGFRRRKKTPSEARRWNGCPAKGKRKKTPRHKRKSDWTERMTNRKKLPEIQIVYPSKESTTEIYKQYAPVAVGDKWVHAGCFVFVPRRVYKNFELVRKTLSDRLETLHRADPSEEW